MKNQGIDRREFLLGILGTGAACSQLGILSAGCSRRDERHPVTVSGSGFMLDGKVHPIYSGSFHYWRHRVSLWPELFDRLSRLGLNTICTSVPWEVHEISRGRFDFGKQDKSKNLSAFIDMADRKAFKVLLRVGPHINAELTCLGYPPRVLFDPDIAARTSVDTLEVHHTMDGQFPIPSYSSDELYGEIAVYFDALMPIIAESLYPRGGPVVGIQVDNGTGYFSRIRNPYSIDYHPQALELYRGWLREKYSGSLALLNRYYRAHYQSFELVEPPRRFRGENFVDLPPYLDWTEFREWTMIWSLSRISRMLPERGITGIPVFHCLAGDYRAPLSVPDTEKAEGIDLEGINGYPDRNDYSEERRTSRAAAGLSVCPFRPEFGGGRPLSASYSLQTGEDLEFTALATLMHGVKNINFYMAVERDRWLAAPIRRDGRPREEYFHRYRRILRFLREMRFHEFEKQVEVIFLFNHGLDRLFHLMKQEKSRVLSIPGEVFAETVDFGFHSSPEACEFWMEQTTEMMLDIGFDWNYGSTRLSSRRLGRYKAAVLPAGDFLYLEELEALESYVKSGGILIFGPGKPSLNQWMRAERRVEAFFSGAVAAENIPDNYPESRTAEDSLLPGEIPTAGKLIHMQSPLEVIRLLKAFEVSLPFSRSNKSLDLSLYARAERRLLFVANGTDKAQVSDIYFPGSHRFRGLLGGEDFAGRGKVKVELAPYKIEVWEVS